MIRATPLERLLIDRVPSGQVIPRYGSLEFDALPEHDPRRAASIIAAARLQRLRHDPDVIAAELRVELAHDRQRLREASWDVAAARDWAADAQRPTFRELERRRSEPKPPALRKPERSWAS